MHAIREPPESPGGSKQSSHGPSYGVASTGAQWVQPEQRLPLHEASAMHQSSQADATRASNSGAATAATTPSFMAELAANLASVAIADRPSASPPPPSPPPSLRCHPTASVSAMGRGGSEDSALGGCLIASCVCFIAVPAVIMIVLSFATLEQTQYGLDYNGITLSVDNITMASSGLYFLGLGHSFIKFPKVVQTIEFNSNNGQFLHTRTSDGLPLTLGVSFQFTYNPTRLYDLYVSYKGQHRHVYENTATAVIANLACNFSAYEFFNDKAGITVAMQARVRDVFARQLYANVVSFQISKVELPASFQAAILESISTKQNITRSERYRDNMMVTFEQQVMVAQQEKNQTITAARGNAARRTQQALAAAQVTNQTVSAEIRAFSNLAGQLDFHSQDGLEYLWWDLLSADAHAGDAGKEFLVGVNPAAYISQGSH